MEKGSGICYCCLYFEKYYIKGATNFIATKVGRCWKTQECVGTKEICEYYERKPKRSNRANGMIKKRINDLMTELAAIRQILEENERENDGQKNV